MQKYKIIAIAAALLLLLSGCGESNSQNEESEKTSKEPPARKVVEAKTEYSSDNTSVSVSDSVTVLNSGEAVPFLSVTGNVVSISTKDITVEFSRNEYIFTINDDTKTYGGKIGISDVVTVTYEVSDNNLESAAKIITVLSDEAEITEDETVDIITETGEKIEEITEGTSENNVYTGKIPEEIQPETSFEEVRTTIEVTEPTTTTQDNSEIISALWNNISVCEQQIDIYEWGIDEYNKSISEFEKLKSDYEDALEDAKIDLQNAMKRKVWVYSEGYGFQQIPDESAVSDAQEYVDFYEGLIAECDAQIEEALLQISKCELEIDALESEIVTYQAEIAELS